MTLYLLGEPYTGTSFSTGANHGNRLTWTEQESGFRGKSDFLLPGSCTEA